MTTAQDSPTRPILTEERRQFLIAHGRRIRIDSWDEQLNYRNTLEREALVDPDVPGVFLSREEASSIAEAARKPAFRSSAPVVAAAAVSPETATADGALWIASVDYPGYASDQNNRLSCISPGKGRKVGHIISLTRVWVNKSRKGGKPIWRFLLYFQLTVDGKRVKVPYYKIAMERNRLEGKAKYGS